MWSYRCVEDPRPWCTDPHGPLAARYLLLMPLTRDDIRESVERAGDEHWDALRRHHEDAYPNPKPTPGDVCKGEAERLNQLGLGDAKGVRAARNAGGTCGRRSSPHARVQVQAAGRPAAHRAVPGLQVASPTSRTSAPSHAGWTSPRP